MRLYKFCLFSSQDFDFFRTPEFLGPKYLIMMALPYEAAKELVSPDSIALCCAENNSPIPELAQRLKEKLAKNTICKAIFDARTQKSEWHFEGMHSLPIDTNKMPQDVLSAQKYVEEFLLLKSNERKLLAPTIPWQSEKVSDHVEALSRKSLRSFYDLHHAEISAIIYEHDRKRKLLVHVCCGPDAAGVITQLKDEFDLTCFWYDPNIQPQEEYQKRLEAFLKVCDLLKVNSVVGEYDVDNFLTKISGLEASPEQGAKCTLCYDMRLERSAQEAKTRNCDFFTTTLAISPHKVQEKLKFLGEKLATKYGVPYIARNFMKHEGFKDSVRWTNENKIYRQDYCGCWFSLHEGGPNARALAEKLGLTKEELKIRSIPHDNRL